MQIIMFKCKIQLAQGNLHCRTFQYIFGDDLYRKIVRKLIFSLHPIRINTVVKMSLLRIYITSIQIHVHRTCNRRLTRVIHKLCKIS